MIPQEKSAAVTRGLSEAFGVSGFDEVSRLTKGQTSSLVFRIVVQGSPYMLRIIMRTDSIGPACHFACMNTAAEAGLAPRVWYTSIEDRLSITDFVDCVPFPRTEALVRMPRALRALHSLPPFPTRAPHLNTSCTFLLNKGPARDGFIQRFQAANILPKCEAGELFARFEQIAAAYQPHGEDTVSSHNDLFKPDNVLFDGDRVWLVDWEAAFLNDRFADLAVVANLVVSDETEENIYLQEYLGQRPDEHQLARFFLMKQVTHIFYAMAYLFLASSGEPVNLNEPAPEFRDFHRRFWAGKIRLADKDTKIAYGRVHLEQLLNHTPRARLEEALRIASDR